MDSSRAQSAEGEPGELVGELLTRMAIDPEELPEGVVERLNQRARHPEHRLSVGRYLIIGELGRGGMGVVYEAWDPGIERHVAVKTIEPELVPEEERDEVIARFRRETRVVGRLHHPAIVTIFDFGQERALDPATQRMVPSLYYYVMEYLEGQSLARTLRDRQSLPDEDAVQIAADIAEALQLSHDAGIIHRDIKPSNIFLRGGTEAVLLDFGIAKTGSVALTRQGQILGTPSYLAPERLREKEVAIDGRADIFSLGVLLYTMITGEAPFVGEDVYEVIDKIAKESHTKLGRDTPSGQALSRVIDRMLAKLPSDRYSTAGEAARALREVLALMRADYSELLAEAFEELPENETTNPSRPTPVLSPRDVSGPGDEATGPIDQSAFDPVTQDDRDAPRPARSHSMGAPETELMVEAVRPRMPEDSMPTAEAVRADSTAPDPVRPPPLPVRSELRPPDTSRGAPPTPARGAAVADRPPVRAGQLADSGPLAPSRQSVLPPEPPPLLAPSRSSQIPIEAKLISSEDLEEGPEGEALERTVSRAPGAPPPGAFLDGEASLAAELMHAEATANGATELHTPEAPVRAAALLGTRPELALQRETRELRPALRPRIEDIDSDEPPGMEDTSPSIPGFIPEPVPRTKSDEEYPDHAEEFDEATDDETVADPSRAGRVPSGLRNQAFPRAHANERPTEQVVRASSPEHADIETESVGRVRAQAPRVRRSRIEASLVDEDDVVVKPAPMDALKPDELPTQTGFKLPNKGRGAEVAPVRVVTEREAMGRSDVVRARGDSRVPDPAEADREDAGAAPVVLSDANADHMREIDLEDSSGPVPELDAPRSAAVARRTFGAAARASSKRAGGGPGIQVRYTGNSLDGANEDRMRLIRRRGIVLVSAVLGSVALGLLLGRMKQSVPEDPETPIRIKAELPAPQVEPRAGPVRRMPGTDEPDLVRPRPPTELMSDAEAARNQGQLDDAARLFESALGSLSKDHPLRPKATLGRADVLRQSGQTTEAVRLYRVLVKDHQGTEEAEQARVALEALGVPARPTSRAARTETKRPDAVAPAAAPPPTEPKPKELVLTDGMSPDEKCTAIVRTYLSDAQQAVRALERLEGQHPNAPCVFWNLGKRYEWLSEYTAAIEAYKRYLTLEPSSEKRRSIEDRIRTLEAKLRSR